MLRCPTGSARVGAAMSLLGHFRHFERAPGTSGLPLTPDVSLRRNKRRCGNLKFYVRCCRAEAACYSPVGKPFLNSTLVA